MTVISKFWHDSLFLRHLWMHMWILLYEPNICKCFFIFNFFFVEFVFTPFKLMWFVVAEFVIFCELRKCKLAKPLPLQSALQPPRATVNVTADLFKTIWGLWVTMDGGRRGGGASLRVRRWHDITAEGKKNWNWNFTLVIL